MLKAFRSTLTHLMSTLEIFIGELNNKVQSHLEWCKRINDQIKPTHTEHYLNRPEQLTTFRAFKLWYWWVRRPFRVDFRFLDH